MGISILFGHSVATLNPEGIAIVQIAPMAPFEITLCHRGDAKLSSGAKLFLEYVKESLG